MYLFPVLAFSRCGLGTVAARATNRPGSKNQRDGSASDLKLTIVFIFVAWIRTKYSKDTQRLKVVRRQLNCHKHTHTRDGFSVHPELLIYGWVISKRNLQTLHVYLLSTKNDTKPFNDSPHHLRGKQSKAENIRLMLIKFLIAPRRTSVSGNYEILHMLWSFFFFFPFLLLTVRIQNHINLGPLRRDRIIRKRYFSNSLLPGLD